MSLEYPKDTHLAANRTQKQGTAHARPDAPDIAFAASCDQYLFHFRVNVALTHASLYLAASKRATISQREKSMMHRLFSFDVSQMFHLIVGGHLEALRKSVHSAIRRRSHTAAEVLGLLIRLWRFRATSQLDPVVCPPVAKGIGVRTQPLCRASAEPSPL